MSIISKVIQHKKVRERHPDSAKADEGTLYGVVCFFRSL
jgi:hypothetical protein